MALLSLFSTPISNYSRIQILFRVLNFRARALMTGRERERREGGTQGGSTSTWNQQWTAVLLTRKNSQTITSKLTLLFGVGVTAVHFYMDICEPVNTAKTQHCHCVNMCMNNKGVVRNKSVWPRVIVYNTTATAIQHLLSNKYKNKFFLVQICHFVKKLNSFNNQILTVLEPEMLFQHQGRAPQCPALCRAVHGAEILLWLCFCCRIHHCHSMHCSNLVPQSNTHETKTIKSKPRSPISRYCTYLNQKQQSTVQTYCREEELVGQLHKW